MSALYVMAPTAMLIVAVIGALTAFHCRNHSPYPTRISNGYWLILRFPNSGFMFLALERCIFIAAMFHVVTHAFFQGLFCSWIGSSDHAMHGVKTQLDMMAKHVHFFDPQDMRFKGGLQKSFMPP